MTTSTVLAYPDLDQLEGGSSVKGEATHIGQERRNAGKAVRWQIFVNCTVKNGGESTERDHAIALHEIPLMRKRYGMSGIIEPRPHWVSGVARAQSLSEIGCRDEEERLKKCYGEVFAATYGGANGIPPCLWAKVSDLTKAWNAMQTTCKAAERRITADDINRVIASIAPREELLEPLEDIADPSIKNEKDASGPSIDGALLQHLIALDIPDDKATAFATEVALADGPELTDEAWARVPGVGLHKLKRGKLLEAYEAFVSG